MLQNVAEIISRSFPVNWVFKRRLTNIESGFISQPFFFNYNQMARHKVRLKMVLNCIVTWPLLAQGRVSSFVSATALFWSSCHASGSSVIQSKTRDSTQETLVWTVTAWAIPRAIWAAPGGRAAWIIISDEPLSNKQQTFPMYRWARFPAAAPHSRAGRTRGWTLPWASSGHVTTQSELAMPATATVTIPNFATKKLSTGAKTNGRQLPSFVRRRAEAVSFHRAVMQNIDWYIAFIKVVESSRCCAGVS